MTVSKIKNALLSTFPKLVNILEANFMAAPGSINSKINLSDNVMPNFSSNVKIAAVFSCIRS